RHIFCACGDAHGRWPAQDWANGRGIILLFNSDTFLFLFLPLVLLGFYFAKHTLGAFGAFAAQVWLAGASIVFYASAGLDLLFPLAASIAVNYAIGRTLSRRHERGLSVRLFLAAGITFDLLLLGYFKYAAWFAGSLRALGAATPIFDIALPLGISFYTFTQIAFLVDAARGEAREYGIIRYVLFVTFFPHLIAGPIIHHKEMMPQFDPARLREAAFHHVPRALTLFAIGLAKKVILADGFANLARPVFAAAASGVNPDLIAAWGGMFSYAFQIYFDFSGYSDMALGLALMFGITLPVNFLSPYKADSIIDFWRRWHMTLSRFLRDYLYFPLGGNRAGRLRRYANLIIVMTLGGLWHGAGWTFVLWGFVHGIYLLVNHAWRAWRTSFGLPELSKGLSRAVTFLAVALAWVLFRADTLDAAGSIYSGLVGANGIVVTEDVLRLIGHPQGAHLFGLLIAPLYFDQTTQWLFLGMALLGLFIANKLPNSMQLCGFAPAPDTGWRASLGFQLAPRHAIVTGILLFASVSVLTSGAPSEFIYYRF
ncbi:MAG TPA: MBOAT family protein, partial [Rhizomicrobium sp.]|nr:MBOAT family protein [Rhizomicrobium sp.]